MVDLKDFRQGPTESVWEADQRLKKVIRDGEFLYDNRKHKEWFIDMLLPHLRGPMGQQAIETRDKALEIAMKLEATPRDDAQFGVQQIQGQLEEMYLEIQNLWKERGKEAIPDVWCIICRVLCHTKDKCPLLVDYMQAGGPSP